MNNYSPDDRLAAAIFHQSHGRSVIPAAPNKTPLVKWKRYIDEIPSEAQIMEWWSKYPNANLAMITGAISKLIVLDLDIKHGRTSKEFDLPATACAKSGSGGEHFYFNYPGEHVVKESAIFGPGVDIQGDNGLIILPPSVNEAGGVYEWIVPLEDGVADMPEWLSDIVIDEK